MFLNPQTFFLAVAVTVALFWSLPPDRPALRRLVLVVFSVLAILMASPASLAVCLLVTMIVWLHARLWARFPGPLLLWTSLILVAAPMVLLDKNLFRKDMNMPLITLGLAYFTIKSLSMVIDVAQGRIRGELTEILTLNLFFPIYASGPIERAATFSLENLPRKFRFDDLIVGLGRISIGLLKVIFISGELLAPFLETHFVFAGKVDLRPGMGGTYAFMLLKWFKLYVSFSGYSDIAIGAGRLFGFQIVENFKRPFLAENIQNYWQRWHLSMVNFVFAYLYRPFVRRTGKITIGLCLVFLVIGAWHELSVNFLFWGAMHSAAMVFYQRYRKYVSKRPRWDRIRKNVAFNLFSRILTLSYVAWVSAVATSGSVAQGLYLCRLLLGL